MGFRSLAWRPDVLGNRHYQSFWELTYDRSTAETRLWVDRIMALGGVLNPFEIMVANDCSTQLAASSYSSHVYAWYPFIGAGVACARVPLRDTLGRGAATNHGFVDADCTTAGGIANVTEASKWMDSLIKPSELGEGTVDNGGLFHYERAIGLGTNVEPIGCYNSSNTARFVIDLRSNLRSFRWGNPSNGAGDSTAAGNGFYLGVRASPTSRFLTFNGTSLGTNSTSDGASGDSTNTIALMGSQVAVGTATPFKGRSASQGMVSGGMTTADAAAFKTLIDTYLVTPTGR